MKHVAIVFRHGDRSPTFNAMEPLATESAIEAAAWALSLPTKTFSNELARRFPVVTHHKQTRDEGSLGRTFGSLTGLGVLQMRRLGEWISARSDVPVTPRRVLSSNFRRTQFSAQCLLAGICKNGSQIPVVVAKDNQDTLNVWGTDPVLRSLLKSNGAIGVDIAKTTPEENHARNVFLRAVPAFGFMIRPFSWISAMDHFMCREGKTGGGGPLRGRSAPMRISEIFKEMDTDNLGALDPKMLKAGFDKVLQSPFSGATAGVEMDKFIRVLDKDGSGHVDFREMKLFLENIRLPVPSGGVTPEEFESASKVIEKAVCRRFDTILSQPSVRRISAGSMAKNIVSGLDEAIEAARSNPSSAKIATVDLYSAHDVSLTPLLKHLGIWDGLRDPWPGVSAALAFEMTAGANGSNPTVRVLYWNGVRGEISGLEPRVLGLEHVPVHLHGPNSEADNVFDLEKFRSWAISL